MGGDISVESKEGKGTIFTVTLPLLTKSLQGSQPESARASPHPAAVSSDSPVGVAVGGKTGDIVSRALTPQPASRLASSPAPNPPFAGTHGAEQPSTGTHTVARAEEGECQSEGSHDAKGSMGGRGEERFAASEGEESGVAPASSARSQRTSAYGM